MDNFTRSALEDDLLSPFLFRAHLHVVFKICIQCIRNFHIRNICMTSNSVSRYGLHKLTIIKEICSLIFTSAIIERLAPSAVSIYFHNFIYLLSSTKNHAFHLLSYKWVVAWNLYVIRWRRRDEKFWRNGSETGAEFRHAFFPGVSRTFRENVVFPEEVTITRTPHFIVSSARISLRLPTERFALLYYELITDKQRSTWCADITKKKKKKKKLMRAKVTPITRGRTMFYERKKKKKIREKLLRTRNARPISLLSFSENQETRFVAIYIEFLTFV